MDEPDDHWLAGLEERARVRLPRPVHEYVATGARDGTSAAEAADAWRRIRFRPRVLRDVHEIDASVELLGVRHPMPFHVAPSTLQRAVHPDGELAMAAAVAGLGGLMVVSSNAGTPFVQIQDTGVRWWVQCYVPEQRELAEPLLGRAVAAGASAVVLTVDTPVVGVKYAAGPPIWEVVDPALLRVNLDPGHDEIAGWAKARDLGPADVAWLHEVTGLPVVVKGVLRGDDALVAVEAGAAAVWVSNHGGRQLDRAVATAVALPEVSSTVAGRVPVYVDGGLRSGLDVLAALGLGATATFLGRLPLWALVDGEAGVRRALRVMGEQVADAMRLAGVCTPTESRDVTTTRP